MFVDRKVRVKKIVITKAFQDSVEEPVIALDVALLMALMYAMEKAQNGFRQTLRGPDTIENLDGVVGTLEPVMVMA
jgi:hypothetical protein